MTNSNINSAFTPILVALTTLTLYLISGSLVNARASPPFFFTVGLGLIFAAYVMTPLVALAAVGAIFFAELFLALDHIHGECWYGVMVGGSSWHKERLGELAWHRQCVQSSQAWWIMAVLGLDEKAYAVVTVLVAANTLLRPFSRFSISSLFRSTPSLPQSTLLVPFLNVDSLLDDVQQASRTPPSTQDLTKWLLSLRDYINQLKEAVPHHKLSRGDPEIQDRITTLTDAFLGAIRLLVRELWGSNDETNGDYPSSSRLSDSTTFGDCVRDILQAVFYFRQDIHDHDGSTYILDQHILGSIFPPEQTKYDRLAPILAHPRTLIASLQHHPTRPLASSKLKSNAFPTSPVAPFIPLDVSEDEVQRALELLNILIEGVEMIDHLPGPVTAKNKK
ncbi:hypothetical protein I316_02084 [Kwoniella heveanensis BCC8398]|uniref:Uncharacterized protein n=1 Tax=Kwoniella heveanensis BCC8398 TaxID=1296120 RepID=A0A1B9GYU6_9TREE|nr:hypothetical protein I316_02084 [Kwoniella heveanensis BCC8398]